MNHPQGNKPQRRAFRCTHCQAEILIPADLPATSAPCPHCQKLVTSPGPKADQPVPEKRTEGAPKRLNNKAKPAAKLFAHEASPEARAKALKRLEADQAAPPEPPRMNAAERKSHPNKPVISRRTKEADKAGGETRSEFEKMIDEEVHHVDRTFRRVLLASVVAGLAVATFFHLRREPNQATSNPSWATPEQTPHFLTPEFIAGDWVGEARHVLRGYLNANTAIGKAQHILRGEELLSKLEGYQRQGMLYDLDTPADDFQPESLGAEDHQRGLFLMGHQRAQEPDPASATEPLPEDTPLLDPAASFASPTKIHAFFKHTDDGLKLDGEVFVQTKHRRLRDFAIHPVIGATATFRVLIAQDSRSEGGDQPATVTYLISDPANLNDRLQVLCIGDTAAAHKLAEINWVGWENRKPSTRTATIELAWGGEEEAPRLLISRFLCWEFLGLGTN